jgi:hypothetical protein
VALATQRPLWLVGADICVFARLDLARIPERHRARAVAERARQLSPFPDQGWHAADRDGSIALWCWDAAGVRAAMAADPESERAWEIVPEQVFFSPVRDACLRERGATMVLERWCDDELVFSTVLPAAGQHRALCLRSAGLDADADLPVVAAEPGPRWDRRAFDWRRMLREPFAAGVALLALASLWLLWSLGVLGGTHLANHRLANRIATQQQNLAPLLEQREQALAIAARNAALAASFEQVSAIEAAAEFEYLVGARYQRMLDWEFSPRALRVTLQDATPDNRAYVEALERSPWFDRVGVSPAPNPDQITLQISLAPRATDAPLYVREALAGGRS